RPGGAGAALLRDHPGGAWRGRRRTAARRSDAVVPDRRGRLGGGRPGARRGLRRGSAGQHDGRRRRPARPALEGRDRGRGGERLGRGPGWGHPTDGQRKSRRRRRAGKESTAEPVAREAIEDILEVGRWSGSGGNRQPTEVIVVRDPEVKRKFGEWGA